MKGTFVSVWDGGTEVRTPAELDERTGEVTTESLDGGDGLTILDREYFESSEKDNAGEEYEVCTECHTHILKVVMKSEGHTLYEALVCSDSDCENQ
jgi:hypothetical protein